MNRHPLEIVQDLAELVEAIDRRLPQLQRSGESDIMQAATRLRLQAQARMSELTVISRDAVNARPPADD